MASEDPHKCILDDRRKSILKKNITVLVDNISATGELRNILIKKEVFPHNNIMAIWVSEILQAQWLAISPTGLYNTLTGKYICTYNIC